MSTVITLLTVGPVDVDLLRQQRGLLLTLLNADSPFELDGLVDLLDHMLDVAEGVS